MVAYDLIIGVLGVIVGLISIIYPKKMSRIWRLRGWFILAKKPKWGGQPTAEEVLGEERGSKFVFWIGWIVMFIGLGFIIYSFLS